MGQRSIFSIILLICIGHHQLVECYKADSMVVKQSMYKFCNFLVPSNISLTGKNFIDQRLLRHPPFFHYIHIGPICVISFFKKLEISSIQIKIMFQSDI